MLVVMRRHLTKQQLAAIHTQKLQKTSISNNLMRNVKPGGISEHRFKDMRSSKNRMIVEEKIQSFKVKKTLEKLVPNKIEASVTPIPGVNIKASWELKPNNQSIS